ncbi:MAG TPA: zf-HC2 domain-containing protein [Streptosporangiaceae bacterium]
MTDFAGCQHVRQSLGVYVLGAIDPAERAQVDAHLASCPDCREELAGLAGLPALLGHVPVAEAARISGIDDDERLAPGQGTPVPDGAGGTLTPLLARMAHRRKVSRWRNLAAAAAVVVVAAGAAIGAVGLTGSGSAPPAGEAGHWERVQATDPATLAHVAVRYEGEAWGTVMDASVTGIPAGTTCQLWVLGRDGHKWAAGGWTVTNPYEQTTYPASSPVQESAVRGFEVTSGHTVLVHVTTPT